MPLILTGIFLNAMAQLCLKQGMRTVGIFNFTLDNIIPIGFKVLSSPHIVAGLFCYVLSVVIWIMVLSRVDVSYAYPLLSVGYIVTALAGRYFFGEPVGLIRWSGIVVICVGVYMITRSS